MPEPGLSVSQAAKPRMAVWRRRHVPHAATVPRSHQPRVLLCLQGSTPLPMVAMEVTAAMWWSVQPPSEEGAWLPGPSLPFATHGHFAAAFC